MGETPCSARHSSSSRGFVELHLERARELLEAGHRRGTLRGPGHDGGGGARGDGEREVGLGDGHFPALRHHDAGVRIAIGSDSNVRVDPFEETRELETLARRERRTRHALLARHGDLWGELAAAGRASLGLDDAGTIRIDRDHPDLRGVADADLPPAIATCASAAAVLPG